MTSLAMTAPTDGRTTARTAEPPAPYLIDGSMPIGHRWRAGGGARTHNDFDPWSGLSVAAFREASPSDVDEAYTTAARAQQEWAAAAPAERAAVLLRAADLVTARHDELAGWLRRESGGAVAKIEVELGVVRAGFLEAAGMPHHVEGRILPSDIADKENRVYRVAAGVVCLISPWDFPLYLTNRTLAPALAVGNAVVLKPSSNTPVTGGLLLAKVLEEAGLPAGVLQVLVGSSEAIGAALVSHPVPSVVSFTGSTETGLEISRQVGVRRLLFELGGNAPVVVLDDADLEAAVDSAVFGAFFNSGQICMRANRLIVDRTLHDDFVDAFVARTKALGVGDPADPATFVGPVISHHQLASVREKVARSVEQGATLVLDGEPGGPAGLSLPPQVLVGTNDVATAQEEVFGPAITIIRAEDEAHALGLANDTIYGLSSAVHTGDRDRGVRFGLQLRAGMTHVNDSPVNEEDNTAYGGVGLSGLGRFGGSWSVDELTSHHWISVQHRRRPYPI